MKYCPECGNAVFDRDEECKICCFEVPDFFAEYYDDAECKQLDGDGEYKVTTCPSCGGRHALKFCPDCGYDIKHNTPSRGRFYNDCAYIVDDKLTVVANGVTEFVVPDGVTTIGESAFAYCRSLKSLVIPEGVTTIESAAFFECPLEKIVVPESLNVCDFPLNVAREFCAEYDNAYYVGTASNPYHALIAAKDPATIKSCAVHPDTKLIAGYAFENCTSLENVTLPDGLESICEGAFDKCFALADIEIPKSVKYVCEAFGYCDTLVMHCKSNDKRIIKGGHRYPIIWDCDNNSADENGYEHITVGDIRYTVKGDKAKVFAAVRSIEKAAIPEYVEHNGKKYKMTEIAAHAFGGCRNLVTLSIPPSVAVIGYSAFSQCQRLRTVNLPDSTKIVGEGAFFDCYSINRIILPKKVEIGHRAFYNSSNSKRVYYKGTEAEYKAESDKKSACIYDSQVYFYSEAQPTVGGKYWHYGKNGKSAVEWE